MDVVFTYQLSKEERELYNRFYYSLNQVSVEQHPFWPEVEKADVRYCYFMAKKKNDYCCAAIITENRSNLFSIASLRFGPLFREVDDLIESVRAIYSHYSAKGFTACTIQLAIPTGPNADYIEYQLNKVLRTNSNFGVENWSSLVIDLEKSEEELFKGLSKGHKSDIKKSLKSNISVNELSDTSEFGFFCRIFEKMNQKRGLVSEGGDLCTFLESAARFFKTEEMGTTLIVKESSGKVVGGIMLVFQGQTVRYFKGASDPDYRHLPILHLAIWEGIKRSKLQGFKRFDLWGFNHFADPDSQVFYINRFKKGFGGDYSFYPKKMNFIYKPWRYKLYNALKKLKARF